MLVALRGSDVTLRSFIHWFECALVNVVVVVVHNLFAMICVTVRFS